MKNNLSMLHDLVFNLIGPLFLVHGEEISLGIKIIFIIIIDELYKFLKNGYRDVVHNAIDILLM